MEKINYRLKETVWKANMNLVTGDVILDVGGPEEALQYYENASESFKIEDDGLFKDRSQLFYPKNHQLHSDCHLKIAQFYI